MNYEATGTEWTVNLAAAAVMLLVLIVFRLCSPLSAAYEWMVEGNEKTVDRSSAHITAFESATSADDIAKERQYAVQYRAVSIVHRDLLDGKGYKMFALVSPQVTAGELFKFLSLATPTNGLFVECQPAKDPFLEGLLSGNISGQAERSNAVRSLCDALLSKCACSAFHLEG